MKTFVDVRTREEYAEDHISGSLNIPLDQIPKRIGEFRDMKGTIVVYCRSGQRSAQAEQYLKSNGFHDVMNGGGIVQAKKLV